MKRPGILFAERITAELVSADISAFLAEAVRYGITFTDLQRRGPLSVCLTFQGRDATKLLWLAKKRGCQLRILKRLGIGNRLKTVVKRPVLLCAAAVLLWLTLWLPGKVLFVFVEGNEKVPSDLILECARCCGVSFGASRRELRSENLKNQLLSKIPQLQWVGINTAGCTAVISVTEKTQTDSRDAPAGVSSLVAVRDGIVESCTVTRGSALCAPGQAVREGQVLVSGYTDCGLSVRAERAEGEILARTAREIQVFFPIPTTAKDTYGFGMKKIGLILGKKRINFFKDSGISYTTCDKMYREYNLTLPGGFCLPVALYVEKWISPAAGELSDQPDDLIASAERYARNYLRSQMISGEILNGSVSAELADGLIMFRGEFTCREMIARVQSEEIIEDYGENN